MQPCRLSEADVIIDLRERLSWISRYTASWETWIADARSRSYRFLGNRRVTKSARRACLFLLLRDALGGRCPELSAVTPVLRCRLSSVERVANGRRVSVDILPLDGEPKEPARRSSLPPLPINRKHILFQSPHSGPSTHHRMNGPEYCSLPTPSLGLHHLPNMICPPGNTTPS